MARRCLELTDGVLGWTRWLQVIILAKDVHYNLRFITNMKLTQGFGQLNQSSSLSQTLNGALNSGINMSSAMSSGTYQHYGLNALGTEQNKSLRHFAAHYKQFVSSSLVFN